MALAAASGSLLSASPAFPIRISRRYLVWWLHRDIWAIIWIFRIDIEWTADDTAQSVERPLLGDADGARGGSDDLRGLLRREPNGDPLRQHLTGGLGSAR